LVVVAALSAHAQDNATAGESKKASGLFGNRRISFGVQTGVDIGGAVPMPIKYIPSPINAYPQLKVSLGAQFAFPLYDPFSLGLEVTYKTVAMNAKARIENQKFEDLSGIRYFSGAAQMNMSFTLLEIPLYARYRFGNSSHYLLFGGYYAHVLSADFETIAQKGYMASEPDKVDSPIDAPFPMSFSQSLGKWDAGVILGYELHILRRLHLGLRFMAGCKDIFKPTDQFFEYKMYPMRGAVAISYSLAELKLF
jgi:hypothetical protein